jgi:hypothetical protein
MERPCVSDHCSPGASVWNLGTGRTTERRGYFWTRGVRAAEASWEVFIEPTLESRDANIPGTFPCLEFLKIDHCGIWY